MYGYKWDYTFHKWGDLVLLNIYTKYGPIWSISICIYSYIKNM